MTTQLSTVADHLRLAADYRDVFGTAPEPGSDPGQHIKRRYRELARVIHPDLYTAAGDRYLANAALQRLVDLRQEAEKAVEAGRYGQPLLLATVRTRKAVHEIIQPFGSGDLCATYESRTSTGTGTELASFSKIARATADSDLLQAEARALKKLRGPDANPKWQPFIPELLDSFVYHETGKPRRQANVIARLEGFYNLEQVRRAFPRGLRPIHMVWIWRRLLVTLGHAHDNGVVHGAVLPEHIMIMPEQHGVVLVDWCYSSQKTDDAYTPIKAIVDKYRTWYPREVTDKQSPGPATDIMMAARSMVYLLGGDPVRGTEMHDTPTPFRAFLRSCLYTDPAMRPHDAWRLLKEFDELLERMGPPYFPRRFRPFSMPTGVEN
jgi:serine/threonine protein kinase